MFNPAILRQYAQLADPSSLPASILFHHTARTLTIFDAFPKAHFHLLVLPRIVEPLTPARLASLHALLGSGSRSGSGSSAQTSGALDAWVRKEEKEGEGKAKAAKGKGKAKAKTNATEEKDELARSVLQDIAEEARVVREMVEEEMVKRFGFAWPVWTGFHAAPSLEHLHLHLISSDLCSPSLRTKRHYNTFHPSLGFFLHLSDVLAWLDAEPVLSAEVEKLDKAHAHYEPLLQAQLSCFRCGKAPKNMPVLKEHLQREFDDLVKKKEKTTTKSEGVRKRKAADTVDTDDSDVGEENIARKRPSFSEG